MAVAFQKRCEHYFQQIFLLAYGYYNNIKIEDEFLEKGFEEFDSDSTVFRTSLYQDLKDSPLEINFNQENFEDRLQTFIQYRKKDYESEHNDGELKLFPEAVLGIFPQSGSHLVPDYTYLLEEDTPASMSSFFESRSQHLKDENDQSPTPRNFINRIKEENTFTPFKVDAFQENAIKAIKEGNSVVIQGPPGTGKSQLICNLISDFICSGKKVLVVSQKRAALDVVYARLKEKEMDSFMALVHDFRNDRKPIYQKIADQISKLDEYKSKNSSLDSIYLERNFVQNCRKIDEITEQMEEFRQVLYDESECGISVKELYLSSDLNGPSIAMRQEYRSFHFQDQTAFINKLKLYHSLAVRFNQYDHPFYNRHSFTGFSVSDFTKMKSILEEMPKFEEELALDTKEVLGYTLTIADAEAILSKLEQVREMLGILKNPEIYACFQYMLPYTDNQADLLYLNNTERVIMQFYQGEGPEISLKPDELGKFQEVLQRSMQARKGLIPLLKWRLFSKDKYLIKRVLVANGLKSDKEGYRILVDKIDNRLNLEHNLTKIKSKQWLSILPDNYQKVILQNWFYAQKQALKAKLIFSSFRNFKEYFNTKKLEYDELESLLEALFKVILRIPPKRAIWLNYYNENQVKHILSDPGYREKVLKALQRDFDALCEFDNLIDSLTRDELEVIKKLYEYTDTPQNEKGTIDLFQNSVRLAWIEHIETKYPVLRMVSSTRFPTDRSGIATGCFGKDESQ